MRAWVLAAALSAFAFGCAGELPEVLRPDAADTARIKPRATTIVFFTDIQCPHCRRTHEALEPIVRAHAADLRVVFHHVPLRMHPDAKTAARAAICAERIAEHSPGFDDAYVHELFSSPDLSESACEELAVQRGAVRDEFRRCIVDPSTEARLEHDRALFEAIGGDGVPILFIGPRRLEGSQSRATLEAAVRDALSK